MKYVLGFNHHLKAWRFYAGLLHGVDVGSGRHAGAADWLGAFYG